MGENARMAPGHRPFRTADRPIFVAVGVLHEDGPDEIGPQRSGEVAPRQPFAFVIAANLRSIGVDRAAAADAAVRARPSGGFLELGDLQRGTAHRAWSA